MQPLQLLFEDPVAARDVAFMLQCEYDGCNLVTLPPRYDPLALKTAIALTGAEFCYEGDHHPLFLPPPDDNYENQSQALAIYKLWG